MLVLLMATGNIWVLCFLVRLIRTFRIITMNLRSITDRVATQILRLTKRYNLQIVYTSSQNFANMQNQVHKTYVGP